MVKYVILGFFYPIIGLLVAIAGYRYSKLERVDRTHTSQTYSTYRSNWVGGKSLFGLSWVGPTETGSNSRMFFTALFWPLIVAYITIVAIFYYPSIAIVSAINGLIGERVETGLFNKREI